MEDYRKLTAKDGHFCPLCLVYAPSLAVVRNARFLLRDGANAIPLEVLQKIGQVLVVDGDSD